MDELVERWQLTLGDEYPSGAGGRVWQAELADGTPAVLKLWHPHREALQEGEALERYGGDGAVRLLARDDTAHALLLERAEPGTPLSDWGGDRTGVLIDLLPRLWKDAAGFRTLEDEIAAWEELGELDDRARALARELTPGQGERVLVHQDLHGDNVLAAEREPWLVIDPKPLAAEREFQLAPIVRSGELGHTKRDALYRLDRICEELSLDRERARGWAIVQTTAWSELGTLRSHLDVLEWLS